MLLVNTKKSSLWIGLINNYVGRPSKAPDKENKLITRVSDHGEAHEEHEAAHAECAPPPVLASVNIIDTSWILAEAVIGTICISIFQARCRHLSTDLL